MHGNLVVHHIIILNVSLIHVKYDINDNKCLTIFSHIQIDTNTEVQKQDGSSLLRTACTEIKSGEIT